MTIKKALLYISSLLVLSSCHTYEVVKYKTDELGKVDVSKYTVYIHAKSKSYQVNKPTITPAGVTGELVPLTDEQKIAEIKNPATAHLMKKHKQDLNLYTKTAINDSVLGATLKKQDITEVTHVVAHKHINWQSIGDGVTGFFVTVITIGALGAFVYWITQTGQ